MKVGRGPMNPFRVSTLCFESKFLAAMKGCIKL